MDVFGAGGVPLPELASPARRRHDDAASVHGPDGAVPGIMAIGLSVQTVLDAVALLVQPQRMDIHSAVRSGEFDTDRPPVLGDGVPATVKPGQQLLHQSLVEEEVEIAVRSGLMPDQGVDTPTTVHLVDRALGLEPRDHACHLDRSGHRPGALRITRHARSLPPTPPRSLATAVL